MSSPGAQRAVAAVCAGTAVAVVAYLLAPPAPSALILLVWAAVVLTIWVGVPVALCALAVTVPFDRFAVIAAPASLSVPDILLLGVGIRSLPLLVRREAWTRRGLNPYLLVLLVLWLPSIAAAEYRGIALRLLLTLTGMLTAAAAAGVLARKSDTLRKLEYAFLASGVILSGLAIAQWAAYNGWSVTLWHARLAYIPELGRRVFMVTSVYEQRNLMVATLCGAIAIALQLLRDRRLGWLARAGLGAVTVVGLGVILVSYSRAGRGVVALIFISSVMTSRRWHLALRGVASLGIAAAALVMPPQLLHLQLARRPPVIAEAPPVAPRARPAPVQVKVVGNVNPQSDLSRRQLLLQALEVIKARPLTGLGAGSFEQLPANVERCDPHNTYLQLAVNAGIPALAGFLLLVGAVAWRLVQAVGAAPREHPVRCLGLGALACLLAILVAALFDDMVYWKMLWLAVGAASGASFALAGKAREPETAAGDGQSSQ